MKPKAGDVGDIIWITIVVLFIGACILGFSMMIRTMVVETRWLNKAHERCQMMCGEHQVLSCTPMSKETKVECHDPHAPGGQREEWFFTP